MTRKLPDAPDGIEPPKDGYEIRVRDIATDREIFLLQMPYGAGKEWIGLLEGLLERSERMRTRGAIRLVDDAADVNPS